MGATMMSALEVGQVGSFLRTVLTSIPLICSDLPDGHLRVPARTTHQGPSRASLGRMGAR